MRESENSGKWNRQCSYLSNRFHFLSKVGSIKPHRSFGEASPKNSKISTFNPGACLSIVFVIVHLMAKNVRLGEKILRINYLFLWKIMMIITMRKETALYWKEVQSVQRSRESAPLYHQSKPHSDSGGTKWLVIGILVYSSKVLSRSEPLKHTRPLPSHILLNRYVLFLRGQNGWLWWRCFPNMINDLDEIPFFSALWSTRMLTIPTLPFYNALSGRFTTWHWGFPQISLSHVISVYSFILKCCHWNFLLIINALVEVQFGLRVLRRTNQKAPCVCHFFIFINDSKVRQCLCHFSIFIKDAKDKQSMCFFYFFPSYTSLQRINNVERESDEQEGRQQMLR